MFSGSWLVTAFQHRFSQYERIIVLIAAAFSVYQSELFAKGSTQIPRLKARVVYCRFV